MNKYRNKKVTLDGYTFDSKAESKRYAELKMLLKAGKIKDLRIHPKYRLQDGFRKLGVAYRPIDYIADFEYFSEVDGYVVEDVKGVETEAFKIKKKLFEYRYPEFSLKLVKM